MFRDLVLIEVHQEVGLNENLIVKTINVRIGMMMADEVADAVDVVFCNMELLEQAACLRWPEFFLIFPIGRAIACLCLVNTNVVHDGSHLGDELCVVVELFLSADELSEAMHLEKVLDAHGIAFVVSYHGERETVNK